jgi:cyclophilin family peptidyl-prolyl cis-trans isomerase
MNKAQKKEFWGACGLGEETPMDANNFYKYVIPAVFDRTKVKRIVITVVGKGYMTESDGKEIEYDCDKKIAYMYEHAAKALVKDYLK